MDQTGSGGVTALANGHYVVSSPLWDAEGAGDAGAATWGNGATGVTGPVTEANSFTGGFTNHQAGRGVRALTDGNYAIVSPGAAFGGAVTWANGAVGLRGALSAENSLTGAAGELIGSGGITPLPGGAFTVSSPEWRAERGAVTWCPPSGRPGETVGTGNSLTGDTEKDRIGSGGITVLRNGNYVVNSPFWDNGPVIDAGAVTWCPGGAGRTGGVSPLNSLTGSSKEDLAGRYYSTGTGFFVPGAIALSDGNYLVFSPQWNRGPATDAGAITWGDGATGVYGAISPENSLTGSAGGSVSPAGLDLYSRGRYSVCLSGWNDPSMRSWGAVLLGAEAGPVAGSISRSNSILGGARSTEAPANAAFRALDSTFIAGFPADNTVTLVRHSASVPSSLTVSGPEVEALPNGAGIDFGKVESGGSAGRLFTLKNTGSSALSLRADATGGSAFAVTSARLILLAPGESAPLALTFTPVSAGAKAALLKLSTGADPEGEELFTLPLTGRGEASPDAGPFGESGAASELTPLPGGGINIVFRGAPGNSYLLQSSPDLITWTAGVSVTADPEGSVLWSDEAPPAGKVFYRLKIP